jgi:molecular chaperone HscA
MLKEQQVEASRVIEAIDAALAQDGENLLSESEIAQIRERRDALEAVIETASADELKRLIKAVEEASEFYVARRMNASVKQALTGKKIDEVDV